MADFTRFVRFVARRFNGLSGFGRIADFVNWNEVNSNDWFDIGCGQGTGCDTDAWISTYASMYSQAFDAVAAEQPEAKTLMSFTHHFASSFNAPSARNPLLGVETMLRLLAPSCASGIAASLASRFASVSAESAQARIFDRRLSARHLRQHWPAAGLSGGDIPQCSVGACAAADGEWCQFPVSFVGRVPGEGRLRLGLPVVFSAKGSGGYFASPSTVE